LGSRSSIIGSISGVSFALTAGLTGAVTSEGGCGSASSGSSVATVDGGTPDATISGDDGASSDGGVVAPGDGGVGLADAGPYTGLSCTVTPCAIALAAGGGHVCALLADHTVRCWGQNVSGELGSGAYDAGHVVPSQTPGPTAVTGIAGVGQIAAGGYGSGFGTTCAGLNDAGVLCWGSNGDGVLGIGLPADGSAPPAQSIAPLPLDLDAVSGLALGGFFGCAVVSEGGVSCWGDNSESELGRALDAGLFDPTPTTVSLSSAASAVATGKYHACALLRDRSVECWGAADQGQTGEVVDGGIATPQPIAGLAATQLAASEGSTCAITTAGGVVCWGSNQLGQLGRGDTDAEPVTIDPVPEPVALPTGATALQIASAVGSTCSLLSDHTVWCWGDNAYGELGTGSAVPGFSALPAEVQGLANIVQIAAGPGGWTVCALLQEGSVRCWGVNDADELGVDTSGDAGPDQGPHPVPVRVQF
jgi:alpha-tubulin suppressor-like RCC1 family protein